MSMLPQKEKGEASGIWIKGIVMENHPAESNCPSPFTLQPIHRFRGEWAPHFPNQSDSFL